MRKILMFVLIIIVIIIGFVCTSSENSFNINKIDGVSIEIKEGTLSKTGATIIITDISNEKHLYGLEFKIQKFVDGKWKKVKVKNSKVVFPMIGYYVNENNKLEMKQNWKDLYGTLSKGKYRLIKCLNVESNKVLKGNKIYFSVEFSI
jgi:hypothetical protein